MRIVFIPDLDSREQMLSLSSRQCLMESLSLITSMLVKVGKMHRTLEVPRLQGNFSPVSFFHLILFDTHKHSVSRQTCEVFMKLYETEYSAQCFFVSPGKSKANLISSSQFAQRVWIHISFKWPVTESIVSWGPQMARTVREPEAIWVFPASITTCVGSWNSSALCSSMSNSFSSLHLTTILAQAPKCSQVWRREGWVLTMVL